MFTPFFAALGDGYSLLVLTRLEVDNMPDIAVAGIEGTVYSFFTIQKVLLQIKPPPAQIPETHLSSALRLNIPKPGST